MFESHNRVTVLCKSDYEVISRLATEAFGDSSELSKTHLNKIKSATIIDDDKHSGDAARLGTIVSLQDIGTGSIARLELTTEAANEKANAAKPVAAPVTSSLGIALLGIRVGEYVTWTIPHGHKRLLRVTELEQASG